MARAQLGEALQAELAGKASRATTLLCVGRSQIDVVTPTLPPASDLELPEMVRNQAMRDNNAIGEDALLDFLPLSDDPTQPRKITAVALSHTRLEQLQEVLHGAGLTAQAITPRPYATAALVLDGLEDRNETCLVVHLLAEEVDLIILSGGKVMFWRTLRQPNASHDDTAARRLISEIRRTLLVAQPHLSGQTVKSLYLCGGLQEHPNLEAALREDSQLPMHLVDPFAAHGGGTEAPKNPGRYVPLVGLLTTAASGEPHAIDFLHPRRRPSPPDRRRIYTLAGAAAALLVLLGGYQVWSNFSTADEKIADLGNELGRLGDQLKQAEQRQKIIVAIDEWSKDDINWLDELRDLSLRFPGGRDAVLLRMGLSHGRESGGTIDLVGIVRDPIVVSHIENSLRDEFHEISSRHMQEQSKQNNYTWHFESTIGVTPRTPQQYVSHLPPEEQRLPPRPKPKSASRAPVGPKASLRSRSKGQVSP